jgi:hypothetical protein
MSFFATACVILILELSRLDIGEEEVEREGSAEYAGTCALYMFSVLRFGSMTSHIARVTSRF